MAAQHTTTPSTDTGRWGFRAAAGASVLLHVLAAGAIWAWTPEIRPVQRHTGSESQRSVRVAFVPVGFTLPRPAEHFAAADAPAPPPAESPKPLIPRAPAMPTALKPIPVVEEVKVALAGIEPTPVVAETVATVAAAESPIGVLDAGLASPVPPFAAGVVVTGGVGGDGGSDVIAAVGGGGEMGAVAAPAGGGGVGVDDPPGPPAALPAAPPPPLEAEVVTLPMPEYPPRSRRLGEEGTVLLKIEVLPDGTIGQVCVIQAPDYPRLVTAALESVRQAKFRPAMRGGVPVPSILEVPIRFKLD
jgi:periplasmic protein TonB